MKNVSIDDYIDKIKAIEDPEEEDVLDWLINSYGKDFLQVSFNTEQSGSLANSVNNSEAQILTKKVTGTYDRTEYVYYVKLWYYWDGSTGSYKGLGEPYVAPEPTKPDENTGPFAIITNHLFTSHLRDFTGLFNDAPQIDGNVLIGPDKLSDSFLTYGIDVKGNLYVGTAGTHAVILKGRTMFMYADIPFNFVLTAENDLSILANEMRGYMDYFSSRNFGKVLDGITVLGELATKPDVGEVLAQYLSLPVTVGLSQVGPINFKGEASAEFKPWASVYAGILGLMMRGKTNFIDSTSIDYQHKSTPEASFRA
ncbi:hypothetical protein V6C27_07500 [Peptococcaceae bacterium 1198_IL3148]